MDATVRDFNVKTMEYGAFTLEDILANLETLPLMGGLTYTIVYKADKLISDLSDEDLKRIEKYISAPNESSILILVADQLDKRRKGYKVFKKYGEVVEFRSLNPTEFKKWIEKYFMDHKKKIRNYELQYLSNHLGYLSKNSDMTLYNVSQELEKMINYSNKKEITKDVIDEFVDEPLENSIFKLIDALLEGDTEVALDTLNYMDAKGEALLMILFMIIQQFRNIYKIKVLNDAGLTAKVASKTIGIHPFVGEKALKQSKIIDYKQLDRLLELSLEVDRRSKSTGINQRLLIEQYIGDIYSTIGR